MGELAPTSPRVCGLAIALPRSEAEVAAALQGGAYADYVGRSAGAGSAARLWQSSFARVASAIETLEQAAGRLGVTVVTGAGAIDVAALFKTCSVVTVVAHWRGPEVTVRDLRLAPDVIARAIAEDGAETAGFLRQGLAAGWQRAVVTSGEPRLVASRLAELLDTRLKRLPVLAAPLSGTVWHMDPATLRHFNRTCLDAWRPDAFLPGNRLELADGLHDPARLATLMPAAWTGIADLSSCQSAQLIDEIKQGRADRIVVANERETNPLLRLAVLQTVYELLAEAPRNYAAVRQAVSQHFASHPV